MNWKGNFGIFKKIYMYKILMISYHYGEILVILSIYSPNFTLNYKGKLWY